MLDRFKVPDEDKIYVPVEKITEVTQKILKASGVSDEGAKNSTSVLIGNDLRGVETHGVSNGLRLYVENYASGNYNSKPNIKIVRESATTANIDLTADLQNGDTLDGITLATGNKVLVKDQTDAKTNGIYKPEVKHFFH